MERFAWFLLSGWLVGPWLSKVLLVLVLLEAVVSSMVPGWWVGSWLSKMLLVLVLLIAPVVLVGFPFPLVFIMLFPAGWENCEHSSVHSRLVHHEMR